MRRREFVSLARRLMADFGATQVISSNSSIGRDRYLGAADCALQRSGSLEQAKGLDRTHSTKAAAWLMRVSEAAQPSPTSTQHRFGSSATTC